MESQHNEHEMEVRDETRLFTNVYVKNFGLDLTESQLREMFEKFGRITSLKIMCKRNGQSRGFGFVAFAEPESAEAAVKELNGKEVIDSTPMYVGRAVNRAERRKQLILIFKDANLFIKNLDDTIDVERLRMIFAPFGTITSAKVMLENGRSKGFGFVCFSSPDEATKAITEMNGKIVATKRLYVSLAQRKEERKVLLRHQYQHHINMPFQNIQFIQPYITGGYFVPTLPLLQHNYPWQMAQIRSTPRWLALEAPVHPRSQDGSTPPVHPRSQDAAGTPNSYQPAQHPPNQAGDMLGNISVPQPIDDQQLPNLQGSSSGKRLVLYKYTKNVRNPVHTVGVVGLQPSQKEIHIQGQKPLTASMMGEDDDEEQGIYFYH